jgi:hypothetical protein
MTQTEAKTRTSIFYCILLFTFAPILSLVTCGIIATIVGCEVSEAGPQPCMILGLDIGRPLAIMGVLGWFMFFTIPIGLLSLVVYAVCTRPRDEE